MVIKFIIGTTCACLAVVSFNSSAAIISVDWKVAGDNLITLDTRTGLEWLDLTVTRDQSYNDINAKLGTGQELDGWGYASSVQVGEFFDSFGGDNLHYTGWSFENNGLFDLVAPLWGDTICAANGCLAGQGGSFFITSDITGPGVHNVGGIEDQLGHLFSADRDFVLTEYFTVADNAVVGNTFKASALVRVSAVPVPAAIWLFGSGLLGLIGFARRKA